MEKGLNATLIPLLESNEYYKKAHPPGQTNLGDVYYNLLFRGSRLLLFLLFLLFIVLAFSLFFIRHV